MCKRHACGVQHLCKPARCCHRPEAAAARVAVVRRQLVVQHLYSRSAHMGATTSAPWRTAATTACTESSLMKGASASEHNCTVARRAGRRAEILQVFCKSKCITVDAASPRAPFSGRDGARGTPLRARLSPLGAPPRSWRHEGRAARAQGAVACAGRHAGRRARAGRLEPCCALQPHARTGVQRAAVLDAHRGEFGARTPALDGLDRQGVLVHGAQVRRARARGARTFAAAALCRVAGLSPAPQTCLHLLGA